MLNQHIARLVASALVPLLATENNPAPITRLAGLVKTLETDAFTSGKVSKFPISVEATPNSCASSGSSFPDLVPSQRERLIVYFEDFGAVNNSGKWTSKLRLIGWGNSSLFNVPMELVTAVLIAKISRILKHVPTDIDSPVGSLRCEVLGSPTATTNLFASYTYSETRSQYLLAPYFAFGLDLQLTYVLNDNCALELTGVSPASC